MANALPMMNIGAVNGVVGAAGGVGQGQAPVGLAGLFGLLMGGNSEGLENLGTSLQGLLAPEQLMSMATGKPLPSQPVLPVSQSVDLAEGVTLNLSGAQADVSALVVQLQSFTLKLTQAGINLNNLGDVGELSAAFTQLGMDPAEAVVKAQSIHTMLEVVKAKLGVDGNSLDGALAALMMAGVTGALPQVKQNVEIAVSVQETTVTLVRVQAFNALNAANARTPFGQDVARVVAGLGEGVTEGSGIVLPKGIAKKAEPVTPVVAAAVSEVGTLDAVNAPVIVAAVPVTPLPTQDVLPVVVTPVVDAQAVTADVTNAPSVREVLPNEVIERPEGDVLYEWKPKGRTDVVEKTPAHAKAFDNLVEAARPEVAVVEIRHVGGNGQATVQGLIHVAEKLAYASTHDVVGQVKVHVQQIVDNGGGTVRMQLSPPELGEIRIELRISGGEVSGRISATDATVVQELARDLHSLKQGFADSGLKLAQEGINLMLQNQNQQHGGQHQQAGNKTQRLVTDEDEVGEIDAAEALAAGDWVELDRLVDVKI